MIDRQSPRFEGCHGVACRETEGHQSDEELNQLEDKCVLFVQPDKSLLVSIIDGSLTEHGGEAEDERARQGQQLQAYG